MRGNTIRLLLVADDRRQAWLKGLLQENFRFLTESDAASALARLHQERRVDAIILAPTQGRGLDALRRMHTDPVCHHIPVALLLENASAKEQEEAFSLGAVDVISLPAEDDLIRARFTHLKYELEKQNTLRLLQRIVRRAMKQEDPDQIFLHFLRYLGLFSQAEKVFIFEGDSHAPYYWSTSGEAGVGERTVPQRDYAALRETIDGLFAKYGSVFISDLSRCPCEDEKSAGGADFLWAQEPGGAAHLFQPPAAVRGMPGKRAPGPDETYPDAGEPFEDVPDHDVCQSELGVPPPGQQFH